jgi:DNA modification methylase
MAQENLFNKISENLDKGPVICLGKTFNSEEERRAYYRNELRTKLPELKTIEGFPIGEDEDIINLSDPPYYTACPNPWLNDFITEWEKEKEKIKGRNPDFHVDEPYAGDVSEGKNNPIYMAHSYHTKVPHPAIMRYILHFTQPGDIVFDGFTGTGMTGVASQICGNPDNETKFKIEKEFSNSGLENPNWGRRKCILGDLSPVASFIAHNYNIPIDILKFDEEAKRLIKEVESEYGWMYETIHEKQIKGQINYVIWSDVFTCPNCSSDIVFWDHAVENDAILDEFKCSNCNVQLTKKQLDKKWVTVFDDLLNQTISQTKTVPVMVNYSVGKKRYERKVTEYDIEIIKKIDEQKILTSVPIDELPEGYNTEQPKRSNGINNVHHFYSKRNLIILSALLEKAKGLQLLKIWITSGMIRTTKMYKFTIDRKFGTVSGTLYIPSLNVENCVFKLLKSKIGDFNKTFYKRDISSITQVCSASDLKQISNSTIDYIFTDPPFGANIMYSELNFIWEAWLKVKTNNKTEAIENRVQGKSLLDYQNIMTQCFHEYFRVLKPGKWMTVEFSNTGAAVWNGIQTGLQRAGFVIANVAGLDKKQGSFKAVTTPTAVKQDLVISCYKPSAEFESKFKTLSRDLAVWDFVSEHLHHLPAHIGKENSTTAIVERSPKILFDRLITFYLMRGLPVPIDARDFQEGLKQRFIERDGMCFTAEQAAEYDEKKAKTPIFVQLSLIVTNESDAIEWLKERLRKEAQKYQDIMPDFRIATQSLRKGDTLPELQDILNESFIQETDGKWRTPDPNEAKDREALRTKVLLKEFTGYVTAINQPKAKKLKEVRVEALRAGFKNSWEQKDFKTIVTLGDKIPQNILLEDEQLLMYYDIAKDRI